MFFQCYLTSESLTHCWNVWAGEWLTQRVEGDSSRKSTRIIGACAGNPTLGTTKENGRLRTDKGWISKRGYPSWKPHHLECPGNPQGPWVPRAVAASSESRGGSQRWFWTWEKWLGSNSRETACLDKLPLSTVKGWISQSGHCSGTQAIIAQVVLSPLQNPTHLGHQKGSCVYCVRDPEHQLLPFLLFPPCYSLPTPTPSSVSFYSYRHREVGMPFF